jgi:hypothetical protein
MSKADVAVFGKDWQLYNVTRLEHEVARNFCLKTMYFGEEVNENPF